MINKGLDAYEGVAQRTTELLANTSWPGSRAHVEGLRNALRDVIDIARRQEREAAALASLTRERASLTDLLDREQVRNPAQHGVLIAEINALLSRANVDDGTDQGGNS